MTVEMKYKSGVATIFSFSCQSFLYEENQCTSAMKTKNEK